MYRLWNFLTVCFMAFTLAQCSPVYAVTLGVATGAHAPFCLNQADMVEVAKADMAGGPADAKILLQTKPECGIGEAFVTPKRVVFSGPTKRGATVRVLEVQVDLGDGSKLTLYMLTDVEIEGLTGV